MTKSFLISLLAATALGAAGANATTYATEVFWDGKRDSANSRTFVENALHAPDTKFLSLGLGGQADFGFGGIFSGPGSIFEVTWGNRSGHKETADLFVGNKGDNSSFVPIGSVANSSGDAIGFTVSDTFNTLRVRDTSPFAKGRDGFDIDAVSVTLMDQGTTAVPLPASVLLLGAGLAGLGAARRVKR